MAETPARPTKGAQGPARTTTPGSTAPEDVRGDGPTASEHPLNYVRLFTDGACKGNPGPGGWAYILKHPASGKVREEAGGEGHTTNNRMELMAVIRGLEVMRFPLTVDLYSDSQYVLKGLSQWMVGWKRGGWRTADGQPVKNRDLWMQLDELKSKHTLHFHWVRGHSGHPENERCDRLAVAARDTAGRGP